jgi:hypothetical protein
VNAIIVGELGNPLTVTISSFLPSPGSNVTMFGVREPLAWHIDGSKVVITIPEDVRLHPPCDYAWTIRIEKPR